MPLTCRAVGHLTRTRMFHSVQLLVESKGGIKNEISRLRELDALLTNNSIPPTYIREIEFGTIDSNLRPWFSNESLPRVLNSLTRLKVFILTGPFPNLAWAQFNEEVKRACIRASVLPTLENLELSSIMNLPAAFITEAVQITRLYVIDVRLIVGDPISFARSEPQSNLGLRSLTYQERDETPRFLLQQVTQPGCRFDFSKLRHLNFISGRDGELIVAWSIAALANESLQEFYLPPQYGQWPPLTFLLELYALLTVSPSLDVILQINTFSSCATWTSVFKRSLVSTSY